MKNANIRQQHIICIFLIYLTFFFSATVTVYAEDLRFSWKTVPEPLTGYKIYYKTGADSSPPYNGTGLKEGSSPITLGKMTNTTLTGRDVNETYHFTITAYNDQGEGSYSAIVTISPLDMTAPVLKLMELN